MVARSLQRAAHCPEPEPESEPDYELEQERSLEARRAVARRVPEAAAQRLGALREQPLRFAVRRVSRRGGRARAEVRSRAVARC